MEQRITVYQILPRESLLATLKGGRHIYPNNLATSSPHEISDLLQRDGFPLRLNLITSKTGQIDLLLTFTFVMNSSAFTSLLFGMDEIFVCCHIAVRLAVV